MKLCATIGQAASYFFLAFTQCTPQCQNSCSKLLLHHQSNSEQRIVGGLFRNHWQLFGQFRNRKITGTLKHLRLYHPMPSSPPMAAPGLRLFINAAFPLTRARDSCWKRCLMVIASSSPVWRASKLPSFFTSWMADLCQAPRLSTASGKKTIPCWLQGCQDLSIFHVHELLTVFCFCWSQWTLKPL